MGQYSTLSKLSRVKLPSGNTYALIDLDGRAMLAPIYATTAVEYTIGDYVIYDDDLYLCTGATGGAWDSTKWIKVTVASELKDIKNTMANGIHYRGYTSTSLYEGATTNPIIVNGTTVNCISGDLVIETPPAYAANTAYARGEYVTYDGQLYNIKEAITAANNTGWSAITANLVANEPEFIFDGTIWNELGAINPQAFGKLAYKDSASGTYIAPTGSGTVTINNYTANKQKLSTTTITGVGSTVSVSAISNEQSASFAIRDNSPTTVPVAAEAERVGNADVATAVDVGTSLTGTKTFTTNGIKSATLGGTTTFNTNAISDVEITAVTEDNTKPTFAIAGVTVTVDGDLLEFTNATKQSLSTSTTAASTGTVSINTTASDTGTVGLGTTSIHPAKELSSTSKTIVGIGSTTTVYGTSGSATAITGFTNTAQTVAVAASSTTTVATGSLESGDQLVTSITKGTETANVNVGTNSSATVTVQ